MNHKIVFTRLWRLTSPSVIFTCAIIVRRRWIFALRLIIWTVGKCTQAWVQFEREPLTGGRATLLKEMHQASWYCLIYRKLPSQLPLTCDLLDVGNQASSSDEGFFCPPFSSLVIVSSWCVRPYSLQCPSQVTLKARCVWTHWTCRVSAAVDWGVWERVKLLGHL